MLSLKKVQTGISHVVAVLAILAIGVIGTVAIRTSSAQRVTRNPYGFTQPSYTQPSFNSPTYTLPTATRPSTSTSTSGSVCSANGAKITAPAGSNCSISSVNGVAICYINNKETPCQ